MKGEPPAIVRKQGRLRVGRSATLVPSLEVWEQRPRPWLLLPAAPGAGSMSDAL